MKTLLDPIVLAALTLLCIASPAFTDESATETGRKYLAVKLGDLDELAIKEGSLVLNNFSIAEETNTIFFGPKNKNLAVLTVSCSVKNKSNDARAISLMIVGANDKNQVVWTCHVKPDFGRVQANKTEQLKTLGLLVPRGTKDQTARVTIMACGDF
jgi:hypothetical protein